MPTWSLAARQAATNGAVDTLDTGTTNSNATADVLAADNTTVLITFQLNNPAALAADGTGGASLDLTGGISGTGEAAAGAGTTAVNYRLRDRDNAEVVSGTLASGEFTISDTNIIQGNSYQITSGTFPNA